MKMRIELKSLLCVLAFAVLGMEVNAAEVSDLQAWVAAQSWIVTAQK